MNRIQRDTVLGIVFFGTMAFLLWATVNLTDMSLGKVDPIVVYFENGGGLRVGDPVLVLGKPIGKVTEVTPIWTRKDHRVRLTLRVEEALPLAQGQSIQIQTNGVLGGKQVYIDPGVGAPWPPEREIIGTTSGDALVAAEKFFDGTGPTGRELLGLLQDVRSFVQNLNDPDTSSIGALVNRRELYEEVLGSVQSLRNSLKAVEDGDGFLGRIIKDPVLRDDALRIVTNLAKVSEQLNGTNSTLGRLLNDREMSEQLGQIAFNLDSIVTHIAEGRGALGRIVNDEQMSAQFSAAVANLSSILQKADDPAAGAVGALLGDPELRADFRAIAANLASISDKIDNGKGMLSVLINDEDMGIRLRRILNQVSRALEDAREAAPIANFVQVLLGAF